MFPAQGNRSVEQYLELTDGIGPPIEFSRGRLDFLAMPPRAHRRIVGFLLRLLAGFKVDVSACFDAAKK